MSSSRCGCIDEQDREIRYESLVPPVDPTNIHPAGHGLLKVSHRKIDEARSTEYWPVHTHLEADYQPLEAGEIVADRGRAQSQQCGDPQGLPAAGRRPALFTRGHPDRAYDESYHVGATNTVYTGPDHPSYLQLPIVPRDNAVAAETTRNIRVVKP